MVTFIELRTFKSPYRHPVQVKFSKALYRKMKELAYYPAYIDIEEYINHNDHIVGGWVNSLSPHLKEYSCTVNWFGSSQVPPVCDADKIYLISVMTAMYSLAQKAVSHIKKQQPDATVILGGVHPTLSPRETLSDTGADLVVCGEADHIINSLIGSVKKGDPIGVPGVYYRRGTQINCTGEPQLPPLADIQLDWDLHIEYSHVAVRYIPNIYTTRDCPYRCNFCSIIKRRRFRQLPVPAVVRQIKELRANLDHPLHLLVEDPTFLANPEYANAFIDEMCTIDDVTWVCDTRIDRPTKRIQKIFEKMVKSGCTHVFFGVESSLQHVLDNMNKGIKSEYIVPFLQMARQAGIHTHTGWIVGFPNQTREDAEQDVQAMLDGLREGYISTANYRFLTVYPGSPYECNKEQFGIQLYYTKETYHTIEQKVTHSTTCLEREQIWELYLEGLERLLEQSL